MKGETNKSVKRCLFGKARSPSNSQDQMQSDLESKNKEWNFDFNKEKPISDKFFIWETVSANRAPKFYSRTPSKKNCINPNRSLRRKRRSYTSPSRDEIPKKPKIHNSITRKSTKSQRGNENQKSKNKKKENDNNQKLISQYFRTKPRHVGKIIDLTLKPELKSEPLCDFTNRTYFQTRATASITTRARRRKLSNEA